MKFPLYKQLDQMDCGPTCLRMICKFYGKTYSSQTLRERCMIGKDGVSMLDISEAAESIGFNAVGVRMSVNQLIEETPLPCILHWGKSHFVVLYKISGINSLSRSFMARIFGGRGNRLSSFQEAVEPNADFGEENRGFFGPKLSREEQRFVKFFIADPARGFAEYNLESLESHWLESKVDGSPEGFVLLLHPGVKFSSEADEKDVGINFKQLFRYALTFKGLILQLATGMFFGSVIQLIIPFLTQSVVDVGISTHNLSFIQLILVAQLALTFGRTTVEFLRSWILLHISTRLNLTILSEFLTKLTKLPIPFFDTKHLGDILQRMSDHQRVESFLTSQTLNILFSIFNLVIFGAVLAYFHVQIFYVSLLFSFIYSFWVIMFLGSKRKLEIEKFDISSKNQNLLIHLIRGMQDIKLAGAERSKRWEWEKCQARLFRLNIKALSLTQFQEIGALFINEGKNVFISFLAATAVVNNDLTLGGMLSVQFILGQFNSPIGQLVGFVQSWQNAQISLERLNEIHKLEDEDLPERTQGRRDLKLNHDIVVSNVSFTYPGAGNEPALNGVNLRIPYGKTTAIVGKSGSGKSTLVKLLLKYYNPQYGSIRLAPRDILYDTTVDTAVGHSDRQPVEVHSSGISLNNIAHSAWRKICGVVMQDGYIFPDTIERNISVAGGLIDSDRFELAATVANIDEFVGSLPLGYQTVVGADGNGISHGQKQRILIGRCVYKNPSLIFFDEATNSLDASNESLILKNLAGFLSERTVIVVAHRLSTIRNADQVVVMEAGGIVEIGTHDELILKRGKYFELVSNQIVLRSVAEQII